MVQSDEDRSIWRDHFWPSASFWYPNVKAFWMLKFAKFLTKSRERPRDFNFCFSKSSQISEFCWENISQSWELRNHSLRRKWRGQIKVTRFLWGIASAVLGVFWNQMAKYYSTLVKTLPSKQKQFFDSRTWKLVIWHLIDKGFFRKSN